MSYPRACTAARRLSKGAASSASLTVASAVARFTRHSSTPGCFSNVFSTRCTQEPQVMPVTSSCSSFSRVVPATSLPHEAGYGRNEFLDLAVALAPLEALPDAVAHVVIQKAHADRLQGCRHRVELGEDVDAVLILVDHALQASDLSLDAPQTRLEILLVHRVPVHSSLLASNCPHAFRGLSSFPREDTIGGYALTRPGCFLSRGSLPRAPGETGPPLVCLDSLRRGDGWETKRCWGACAGSLRLHRDRGIRRTIDRYDPERARERRHPKWLTTRARPGSAAGLRPRSRAEAPLRTPDRT